MQSLESLAALAQQGDQRSLQELSAKVRAPLRIFLAQRLPDDADADDVAQETLLRAFQNLDSYDPKRPFKTWLFTIGKRLAINYQKSDRARKTRDRVSQESAAVSHMHQPAEPELGLWHRAQEILSPEAYRAMWMRYVQEASVKEVAAALSRTQVSTKVLLYRARKKLLQEIDL